MTFPLDPQLDVQASVRTLRALTSSDNMNTEQVALMLALQDELMEAGYELEPLLYPELFPELRGIYPNTDE